MWAERRTCVPVRPHRKQAGSIGTTGTKIALFHEYKGGVVVPSPLQGEACPEPVDRLRMHAAKEYLHGTRRIHAGPNPASSEAAARAVLEQLDAEDS
jgi:hypothetical protein